MKKIRLLDCTLRDGGYINDWRFGEEAVKDITSNLTKAGVDFIEIGFLKDEGKVKGRTMFSSVEEIGEYTQGGTSGDCQYCAMCEALNPLPAERIVPNDSKSIAVIRVIVWKRLLEEGYAYCKKIVEKGYKLCVQPNRVDQYTLEEFCELVRKFNALSPMAVYIVDSFGLLESEQILSYARVADRELKNGIALGYHGHNNFQQAFGTAQDLIREEFDRELILDGSVYGIGRGAGNLCTELIANYLNEQCQKTYDIGKLMEIHDRYIRQILEQERWGYLPCYYLTARHKCNPMYGHFYGNEKNLESAVIEKILGGIPEQDKVIFTKEKAISFAAAKGVELNE